MVVGSVKTSGYLMHFDAARRALVLATKVDEVKAIRDKAEALRAYAKQAGESLEMQNYCAEIKIRAERRAGELLAEREPHPPGPVSEDRSHDVTYPPTLTDMGISKIQSSRWQAIASIPIPAFEERIISIQGAAQELTSAGMLRLAARLKKAEAIKGLQDPAGFPVGDYRCIVVDPPWPMSKIEREARPLQGDVVDYPILTLEEITALPVGELIPDEGCHLYLWTTQRFLHDALHIAQAWGFTYQCLLTWVKNVGFTPFSWMYSTEHVIFAHCGGLPLQQLGLRLDFAAPVREHSRKPDAFYELVCKASPAPRLDMFGREARDDFDVWGNEVNRFAAVAEK